MKVKVNQKVCLTALPGSVVEVDENQFQHIKGYVEEVKEKAKKSTKKAENE